jgi:hypothetical protein
VLNASLAPSGDVRRRCTWRGALPTPALPAPSPGAHFRRVATLGSDRRGRQTPKEGYQACATATVIHKGGGCNRQLGCKRCHASSASSGNISPGEPLQPHSQVLLVADRTARVSGGPDKVPVLVLSCLLLDCVA